MNPLRLVLWNVEWAKTSMRRGQRIAEILADVAPDVMCLTETTLDLLPAGGNVIEAEPDYGYAHDGGRRKVVLWSKTPWTDVDDVGSPQMPGGRYISGCTLGVRFTGVCVPWRDAHVRTGRRDRKAWQDHLVYLEHLAPIASQQASEHVPVCLLGDFNQRVPRFRQPPHVHEALRSVLSAGLTCVTGDDVGLAHDLIDHVAVDSGFLVTDLVLLPKVTPDGVRLSDHEGVVITLAAAGET